MFVDKGGRRKPATPSLNSRPKRSDTYVPYRRVLSYTGDYLIKDFDAHRLPPPLFCRPGLFAPCHIRISTLRLRQYFSRLSLSTEIRYQSYVHNYCSSSADRHQHRNGKKHAVTEGGNENKCDCSKKLGCVQKIKPTTAGRRHRRIGGPATR